jgi:DNA-binding FadR family transcriptional regulator
MSTSTDSAYLLKETLLANLRNGMWGEGERLPAERHLAESYGVPRSAVRNALQQLKEMDLIRQRVGSGTYVAPDFASRLPPGAFSGVQQVSPADLMEARLVLEPALIDLVVRNARTADFGALEECCRQAELATTLEQFEYWDGAFHQRIAHASHNAFLIQVFGLIQEIRDAGEWGVLKKRSVTPERRQAYQHEHRNLLNALRARDADAARKLALTHLINVRRNLLDY